MEAERGFFKVENFGTSAENFIQIMEVIGVLLLVLVLIDVLILKKRDILDHSRV